MSEIASILELKAKIESQSALITKAVEALERIADARTAMDGGSIAECRRTARDALSALREGLPG